MSDLCWFFEELVLVLLRIWCWFYKGFGIGLQGIGVDLLSTLDFDRFFLDLDLSHLLIQRWSIKEEKRSFFDQPALPPDERRFHPTNDLRQRGMGERNLSARLVPSSDQ